MKSVAIFTENWNGDEEIKVKEYFIAELQKCGITVNEISSEDAIPKNCEIILKYNTRTGITQDFERLSEELIKCNAMPIILIINAQNKYVDYQVIGESIKNLWVDINPELHLPCAIVFYFENDTKICYRVKTGNEQGIAKLVDLIKQLQAQEKFLNNSL